MTLYTLKKNNGSGLYSVYENGKKVKNDIFIGETDFRAELEYLGISKYSYAIKLEGENES